MCIFIIIDVTLCDFQRSLDGVLNPWEIEGTEVDDGTGYQGERLEVGI